MKKLNNIKRILVIVCAIIIVANNYKNGIDKNYPVMQLGITFIWMVVCFIMYINVKDEAKNK